MIRTIVIDTLTALQTDEYMRDRRSPGHDTWKDYGQTIYNFCADLSLLGFENVYVLGEPGTGKSSGMRTLPSKTNIWFNADNKNPVWTGGVEEYGRKNAPTPNYHQIPVTYQQIINTLIRVRDAGKLEDLRYAFILGHVESFKKGNENMERLKILGKMGTKMQLEGRAETVLYSRVEMDNGKPTYILETQNNGFNTARSHQAMFPEKIPNDYQMIVDGLMKFN